MSREPTEFIKRFEDNSLDANVNKFQSMLLLTKGKNDMSLTINDVESRATDDLKELGIAIDYCLKFDKHTAYLCTKIVHQLNVLQRLKGPLNYNRRLTIYKTSIMPKFNFRPIVWMFSSKKSFTCIENIEKRAFRLFKMMYFKFPRTWWRHQMETFSTSLALCAGNSPVPGEFLAQRPVTRSFDVFFDLRPNKRLCKQSWGWWFETPSRPLWRHNNGYLMPVGCREFELWHCVYLRSKFTNVSRNSILNISTIFS